MRCRTRAQRRLPRPPHPACTLIRPLTCCRFLGTSRFTAATDDSLRSRCPLGPPCESSCAAPAGAAARWRLGLALRSSCCCWAPPTRGLTVRWYVGAQGSSPLAFSLLAGLGMATDVASVPLPCVCSATSGAHAPHPAPGCNPNTPTRTLLPRPAALQEIWLPVLPNAERHMAHPHGSTSPSRPARGPLQGGAGWVPAVLALGSGTTPEAWPSAARGAPMAPSRPGATPSAPPATAEPRCTAGAWNVVLSGGHCQRVGGAGLRTAIMPVKQPLLHD